MTAYEAAVAQLKLDFDLTTDMIVKKDVVEITTGGIKRLATLILDACKVFTQAYILWERGKAEAIQLGEDIEWYNEQEIFLVELAEIYNEVMSLLAKSKMPFPNFLVIMLDATIGHHPAWLDSVGVAPIVVAAIAAGVIVGVELIAYVAQLIAEYYSAASYNQDLIEAQQFMTPEQAKATLKDYKVQEFSLEIASTVQSAVSTIGSVLPIVAIAGAAFFLWRK